MGSRTQKRLREQRGFKTDQHLKRVLAFDLIMAWRILALVKLGRTVPNVPAELLYTAEELKVLFRAVKKTSRRWLGPNLQGQSRRWRLVGRKGDGEPGAGSLQAGPKLRCLVWGCDLDLQTEMNHNVRHT